MQPNGRFSSRSGKLSWLIVGLIVISTALFVTGVALELGGSTTTSSQQAKQPASANSGDSDSGHEGATSTQPAAGAAQPEATQPETILGLNLDNPWFIGAFILGWLALIVVLLRFGRPALVAILLVALAAMILDVGEVVYQVNEARSTLAAIATLVALAHLAIAGLAALLLVQGRSKITPARQEAA